MPKRTEVLGDVVLIFYKSVAYLMADCSASVDETMSNVSRSQNFTVLNEKKQQKIHLNEWHEIATINQIKF